MAEMTTLRDLLIEHLRDLYNAEGQIVEALPKMAEAASSAKLRTAFKEHLEVTRQHQNKLASLFEELGEKAEGHTCKAMKGIIKEGEEMVKEDASPAVKDAGLIAAAQRVEHYEIAGYGCVRTWARLLEMHDMADTLQGILDEEGKADHDLTDLAKEVINVKAAK